MDEHDCLQDSWVTDGSDPPEFKMIKCMIFVQDYLQLADMATDERSEDSHG